MAAACNEPEVMVPINPIDPIDTMDLEPVDENLLQIKNKWEGDYIGTVTVYKYYPYKPSTYDTFYNQKILISDFNRDSVFSNRFFALMQYNDSYVDSSYYGLEENLLSDSVVLYKWPSFGYGQTNITLNHRDSTLVRYANYAPSPDAGSVLHGYYKRQ